MSRTNIAETGPNPVDVYIGGRVKSRRLILGLSQEDLAKSIGLTFQQVQKYERGTNRISVSRLVDICRILKAPVGYFFDGSFNVPSPTFKNVGKGMSDNEQMSLEEDPLMRKDVLEMVRAYSRIKNPLLKKQILEMAKAMSAGDTKNS